MNKRATPSRPTNGAALNRAKGWEPMAKAGWHSTTSVTWIPIRDAYPAILEICLSPPLCESWFIERAAAGRLRC